MNNKKIRIPLLILFILWLSALLFATKYDLDISLAIANENSLFGRLLEIFGEPPAILFTAFNFSMMATNFIKNPGRKSRDIFLAMLCFTGTVGTTFFSAFSTANYFIEWLGSSDYPLIWVVISAVIISVIIIFSTLRLTYERAEKYFLVACRCAFVGVLTFVVIWVIKLLWGRVRFRQLSDLSEFTKWYLPRGINGYFSFPSGHTANAAVIFAITYYFPFIKKKTKWFRHFLYLLLGFWVLLLAFSRVLVGAHYLSDVLFGGGITIAIVYFSKPKNYN